MRRIARANRRLRIALATLMVAVAGHGLLARAQQLRSLGIDISAWQGSISTANWATLKRATNQQVGGVSGDGRDFVIIRSSRGGTTGYYDQSDANNVNGLNTLSQRYDDPYYVQNINRATSAGLFAGTYHFARPDIIESTMNSDGIANTGADEADHMIQMAGPWMRPGFLPPVLDLESGQSQRTQPELTTFCIDFSDRIYQVMGIRPMIYINGSYAGYVLSSIVPAIPGLWSARWPNQANPNAIDVQNGSPKDSISTIYGPWDDPPYPAQPWKFWQYASTAHVNAIGNGTANCDVDVAQGGLEFLKDNCIPAVWLINSDGQWTTLTNWNSGLTPIAPVQGPGQVPRVGTLIMPTPRLPGTNDTVILDRPGTNITITLASGSQNIRKLYMRESLNITGGSLTINYLPAWDSTTFAAQFSGAVTLSGNAVLSAHTLQVDSAKIFTVSGGVLNFNTLNLMRGANPAKLAIGNGITVGAIGGATAAISDGGGSGLSGQVDLAGSNRDFNISSGIELLVSVPISNGGLTKTGAGTMRLGTTGSYAGGTTVTSGALLVNSPSGSGTGSGAVTVNSGMLAGNGIIGGPVTVNAGGTMSAGSPSTIGTLTLNSVPTLNGTNFVKIDRNAVVAADKIVLTSGTLTYGGTLVVSNSGAGLAGGESFTAFAATSYAGAFSATALPALAGGLNWYLGDLAVNGRIKVNRSPATGPLTFTNNSSLRLEIPIASLAAAATDPDGDAITLTSIDLATTNGTALSTNGAFLVYASSVNVADKFHYTVSDGRGGSATGTVIIAPITVGQFIGQPGASGSTVSLQYVGQRGSIYFLERSTDLAAWQTISTNVMPTIGIFGYTDDFQDLTLPPPAAFYRLRWVP